MQKMKASGSYRSVLAKPDGLLGPCVAWHCHIHPWYGMMPTYHRLQVSAELSRLRPLEVLRTLRLLRLLRLFRVFKGVEEAMALGKYQGLEGRDGRSAGFGNGGHDRSVSHNMRQPIAKEIGSCHELPALWRVFHVQVNRFVELLLNSARRSSSREGWPLQMERSGGFPVAHFVFCSLRGEVIVNALRCPPWPSLV